MVNREKARIAPHEHSAKFNGRYPGWVDPLVENFVDWDIDTVLFSILLHVEIQAEPEGFFALVAGCKALQKAEKVILAQKFIEFVKNKSTFLIAYHRIFIGYLIFEIFKRIV